MTMNKIKFIFASALAVAAISSCLKEEAIDLQKPFTYDEQYYENLREFKKSKHTMSYVYYAAWAPLEGSTGYKEPASFGDRIAGLPDSLDICNLWMGYPSPDPENENYSPIAYADMKYAQETLGTRFVLHGDASTTREVTYNGKTYNVLEAYDAGDMDLLHEGLDAHVQIMVDKVMDAGLDGVDVDYEPGISVWRDKATLTYVMTKLHEKLKAISPDMLVILDVYGDTPAPEVEPLIDYFVVQSYSGQTGTGWNFNDEWHACDYLLDRAYTRRVESWGCPADKLIICETAGQHDFNANGGAAYVEYPSGDPVYTNDGSQMYSFEGFARWAKRKEAAGWGVFYVGRSYYATKGPYYDFRRAIQIANPSIK